MKKSKIKYKKSKNFIKICPKCGSINVQTDFSNPVVWDYGTPAKYKCNSCGYLASTFPEVLAKKIADFKKKLKKENKISNLKLVKEDLVDTKPGFYVGIYGIVFIIIGMFFILLIFLFSKI